MMATMVEPLLLKMLTNFGNTALWSTQFLLQRASCEHTVCLFGVSAFACVCTSCQGANMQSAAIAFQSMLKRICKSAL